MKKHTTKELVQAARVARRCVEWRPFNAAIATDPAVSVIHGRNGSFVITELRVWEAGGVTPDDERRIYIDAMGKRGKVINGGITVSRACFEEMCRRYLLRGLPEEE